MNNDFIAFHRPFITDEEINEVVDTLRSGWLSMGPKTIRFEEEFKKYVGTKYCVSINSWTAGGHLALEAIGLKAGDEVIVPTMTFPATAEIVCYFGAKPVIVDVQRDTMNISVEQIEKNITSKTKAIIPVHYAGQPCDMDEITALAEKHNLTVIEDAAHALPASYKGKKIGSISRVTVFSFYATKTLSTGEGGMICTDDEDIAKRTTLMRMHGINRDAWKRYSESGSWNYEVVAPGFKYNFTDIQASLGLSQLNKLEMMWQARKDIVALYNNGFTNNELIETLPEKEHRESAWHLYPIRLKLEGLNITRERFIEELRHFGVGAAVHFMPVHKHIFYKNHLNLKESDYPVAEDIFPRLLSLPVYPGLTTQQVEKVIDVTNDLTRKYSR